MTLEGSCMCGAIAYASDCMSSTCRASCEALCHCVDCQKVPTHPIVALPHTSFSSHIRSLWLRIAAGEPSFYDITGASGKNNRHFFCGKCGSSLYTELDLMADKTVIKAGTLDGGEANLRNKVDVEFYTKDRASYLCAVQGAKQEPLLG
ncbi:hypothetical protein ANOM_008354 [Aspergillus nomiae NRRL 13137]|uniref:CENP-V/GFA domain-containing protein n=1 Tax=Aspergillus nomiae NRRL (strain ATCC 15546 / NRRL 13137 / CBS 260.88 / M93) TaxID=1509407 RepID=A0A0L1IVL6_ASPN3|nr:uncharacterized protein ANOM_008354 [Aspergillus nomiae NRRL 13137]KNG83616.1 hypothetical protein ANOM_008354 [Aspergillus nomiae NRRL 13137]